MKRLIVLVLSCALLLTGCKAKQESQEASWSDDECYLQMLSRFDGVIQGDLYYRELVNYNELKNIESGYVTTTNGTKLRVMTLLETISFLDPTNQLTVEQYEDLIKDFSENTEYSFYNDNTYHLYVLGTAKDNYYSLVNIDTGFELMYLADAGVELTVDPDAVMTLLNVKDDRIVQQSMSGSVFNETNFPNYPTESTNLPTISSFFGKVDLSDDTTNIVSFTQEYNYP